MPTTPVPDPLTRDSARTRGTRPFGGGLPLDPVTVVLALIIIGIALRAFIAGVALPYSGFRIDVGDFGAWAHRLAAGGPGQFYAPDYFSDYPPGYLYVLWLLGGIGSWLQPVFGVDITAGLVKVPAILADGGVAWMLFLFGRRFGDGLVGSWSGVRVGLVAAAIYLFNPATIFDSAVWGQVDAVGALAILVSLYWLARGWTELAAAGAVLALLVKFQFAFVIPIVAIVGIKRHFFGRSTDPELNNRRDPIRVLTSLAAGLGSLVVLIWPFGLGIWVPGDTVHSLYHKFTEAANTYAGLTINAFNIWRNPFSGLGDVGNRWGCDAPNAGCTDGAGVFFSAGGFDVSWQLVGLVLFGLVAVVAYWQVARRDDARGLLTSALILAVAFFTLPTRVHERYLFPALALAAPLVLRGWRWATVYVLLGLSVFANMYYVYTIDWSYAVNPGDPPLNPGLNGAPMARDPVLQAVLFNDLGIYLLGWMMVAVLGFLLWRAVAMTREPAPIRDDSAPVATTVPPPPAPGLPPTAPAAPSRLERFRAWLRPDPGDPYLRERGRRIDRVDALVLVALMAFALLFRLYRLDTPRSMHFDEVYHARSATEWLADWEHGWTRDTYEWTHPELAKYLIAAGIVLADPNKVVASQALTAPAPALTVAPQRTDSGRMGSVTFSAAGSTITARDALTGDELASWNSAGPVAALAYDEDNARLLVGRTDIGQINIFQVGDFLLQSGTRAPPVGEAPFETGLSAVNEIVLPANNPILLARGPDGVAELERTSGVKLASSTQVLASVGYVPASGTEGSTAQVVGVDPAAGTLVLLNAATLEPSLDANGHAEFRTLPSDPAGPIQVRGNGDGLQVWVPVGALPPDDEQPGVDGGITVFDDQLNLIDTAPLPGRPEIIGWQSVANIIYIAGQAPDGAWQLWTVQPIGNGGTQSAGFAAFDTTPLSGEPLAMTFDISDHDQSDDHGRLVVSVAQGAGGALVGVDAGSNAFAWRVAGVGFGTVLVGLIYLLAAAMFRRRRIAVLAAIFVAVDGMSFVMSRIAMNDIFVATFIVAAYLLLWQIWSGRWARSAWWALPMVGVLIGLASASKWVGIYALIGIWVLVLARSSLGRFLLVAAIGFLTIIAGVGAPWPFLVFCLLALAFAALLVWVKPIRLTGRDLLALAPTAAVLSGIGLAFTLAYSQVADAREPRNAVELVFSVLARGAQAAWPAWIMLGIAAALILLRAVVSIARPKSDRHWMQPG